MYIETIQCSEQLNGSCWPLKLSALDVCTVCMHRYLYRLSFKIFVKEGGGGGKRDNYRVEVGKDCISVSYQPRIT